MSRYIPKCTRMINIKPKTNSLSKVIAMGTQIVSSTYNIVFAKKIIQECALCHKSKASQIYLQVHVHVCTLRI